MNTTFTATAWRSAAGTKTSGVTYGLRFGINGRKLIEGHPTFVTLALHHGPTIQIEITPGFWERCPEIRDRRIGEWFRALNITLPWPHGKPHRFIVSRIATNSFKVELA